MKKIYATAVIVFCFGWAKAQFTYDYLKAADNYYRQADYNSAAEYYEKYLSTAKPVVNKEGFNPYTAQPTASRKKVAVSSRQQAVFYLAESYRRLHYPSKAVTYYKQTLEASETSFPLAGYHYATSLRALEQYEEAEKAFTRFLDTYKTDDAYSESARKEILSLRFVQDQLRKKDLRLYTVTRAGTPLNVKGANYAPAWLGESTLLFTSTRADSAAGGRNQVYTNRLYQALYSEGVAGSIAPAGLPQTGDYHQGVVSVTPDGNSMFITRWTIVQGIKRSAIYHSSKTGNGWSDPVVLDSVVNASGFNAQQPFVMEGGKYLLYASDKPGGHGGFDLWYATLDASGKPVSTTNLGEVVNTAYDEQAPYYHAASGTLVFSGNGRIGMGGYDFYYSKGSTAGFSEPVNFGYPVNSVKDDIYFVSRGTARNILEDVFLSSDRAAECCLELFSLKKIKPLKQVDGLVVTCDGNIPLAGAVIRIVDTVNNATVFTKTTGADGSYSFVMEEFKPLKAIASLSGYDTGSLQFHTPSDEEADKLVNPSLCLIKEAPPVEAIIVIENVYYDFDRSVLKETSYPALDKVVAMMNDHPAMVIEIGAHTDDKGAEAYNLKLSEARAASVVAYLVSKGIDKERLQAKGYGAALPVAPNRQEDGKDNPAGRQQNRRTEFKVLKN